MNNNYYGYYPYTIPNAYQTIRRPGLLRSAINTLTGTPNVTRAISPLSTTTATNLSPAIGIGTQSSGITFSGILNGASKTLNVINQAIPVFYQIKPIWNNTKTMFRVAREINKPENNQNTSETKINNDNSNEGPNFFA